MSDLEFQRELSPNQLREALLLLDSTAGDFAARVGSSSRGREEAILATPLAGSRGIQSRRMFLFPMSSLANSARFL
jgi:hypothetical protein